jgi:DNA-binding transcriptional regulator GbsR (MarR family)
MELTPVQQKFVLHWGEMGARWGVNRTVSQIHALLYLADRPMHAEEIAETVSVARSNVSTSLRELQNWSLVKIVHVMGDRRDHFQAQQDVWDIFHTVLEERRKRELDPTLTVLRECVMDLANDHLEQTDTGKKIRKTLEFMELLTKWLDEVRGIAPEEACKLLKLGSKIRKFL